MNAFEGVKAEVKSQDEKDIEKNRATMIELEAVFKKFKKVTMYEPMC